MTNSNSASYNPQQIAHLQSFLDRAQTAYDQGNLFAAQNAVAQYYRAQMPDGALGVDRGYAGLAYGVASGTGVPGRTAMGVLDDVGGAAVTPESKTQLMMGLANADLDTINQNGGGWPKMWQIENYHAPTYQKNGFPVEAWGGAALAHDGKRWDGGALTPAEVGDGSHGTAYQSLTPDQVFRNATSVLRNGTGQTADTLLTSIHPSLPSGADMDAAGNEVGAAAKAAAGEVGSTLDGGWSALKNGFDSLTGTPASPSPPPSGGSSSAAPAASDGTATLATTGTGTDGTVQAGGANQQGGNDTAGHDLSASLDDPSTLTHQDEHELTPDFASWNMVLNGGGDVLDA